jgi:ubiquinone biosynthesis protein Coq4
VDRRVGGDRAVTRWQTVLALRDALSDPARGGDVAVYKSELAGIRAPRRIEAQLAGVRAYHPTVDLSALCRLPDGTFGREYARFLAAAGLHPIVPSTRVDPGMLARNAFMARYATIHDMVHVLTGFDTSWSGETGVWAFVAAQGYGSAFHIAALAALLAAPFRAPHRLFDAWRCWRRGRHMGQRARLVLTFRLEERFEQPLQDVRHELRLPSGPPLWQAPAELDRG